MATCNEQKSSELSEDEKLSWDILKGLSAKLEVWVSVDPNAPKDNIIASVCVMNQSEQVMYKSNVIDGKAVFRLHESCIGTRGEISVMAPGYVYASSSMIITRQCSYHFTLTSDKFYG